MGQTSDRKIWFYAKRYGWGWGLPASWEGWVVFAAYLVLVVGGGLTLAANRHPALNVLYVTALTAGLIAVCWAKGETPRWRWGGNADQAHKPNPRTFLVVHLALGPPILLVALYFRTHVPAEINDYYGYRTALSFSSQEAWDEAQRFSANALIVAAGFTIAFQAISLLVMKPVVSVVASLAVLVLSIVVSVPITERHVHHYLDRHEINRVQQAGP